MLVLLEFDLIETTDNHWVGYSVQEPFIAFVGDTQKEVINKLYNEQLRLEYRFN